MGSTEEGAFPNTADNLELIPAKIGAIQFRVHGLLDRMLAALKHLASLVRQLAALITRMENRMQGPPQGPPDYPPNQGSWWVQYGDREPTPREPPWQNSLLSKIVAPLIVLGIPAILVTLWNISSRMATMEADRSAQEKHLEAHDKMIDEIERELWPHKH